MVAALLGPGQRTTKVLVVGAQPRVALILGLLPADSPGRAVAEAGEVSLSRGLRLARLEEPVSGVAPDRLEQVEASMLRIGEHERLVHQLGQQIEHVVRTDGIPRADQLSG